MKLQKKKKKRIYITSTTLIVIAVLSAVITTLVLQNNQKGPKDDIPPATTETEELTEEDIETTKKTLDETAIIEVLGYRQLEDDDGLHNVVAVTVTNSGQETTSIAADIVAKDDEGNILDKSSLYAENIKPGESVLFNLFVFSTLTAEELQNAKYEVYKANTYEAPFAAE